MDKKVILSEEEFSSFTTYDLNEKIHGEDSFVKNFSNINVSVRKEFVSIQLYKKESKLGLKFVHITRFRKVGKKFFQTIKKTRFISYNRKSKNFYWGGTTGSRKKINTKVVRCNLFHQSPFSTFYHIVTDTLKNNICLDYFLYDHKYDEIPECLDKFEKLITKFFEKLSLKITNDDHVKSLGHDQKIFYHYLVENEIKIPDTICAFQRQKFTKKDLRKNGNLVTTFMNKFELKGKKIRRLLNSFDELGYYYCLEDLIVTYKIFGIDYFNELNEKYFKRLRYPNSFTIRPLYGTHLWADLNITNKYKKKFKTLYNHGVKLTDLLDHLNMIESVNKNGIEFKFKALNPIQFNNEHERLSEVYDKMNTYQVERIYDDRLTNKIEEVLKTSNNDYYPVILKNSKDYVNESIVQKNCVRTYSTKPSIIISLRKNTVDSENRITLEYKLESNTLKRIQSRTRFNGNLDDYQETLCEYLDKKINKHLNSIKIDLPRLLVKNEYFSKVIESYINKSSNYLDWKEDISIFEKNNYDLDLPYYPIDNELETIELDLPF